MTPVPGELTSLRPRFRLRFSLVPTVLRCMTLRKSRLDPCCPCPNALALARLLGPGGIRSVSRRVRSCQATTPRSSIVRDNAISQLYCTSDRLAARESVLSFDPPRPSIESELNDQNVLKPSTLSAAVHRALEERRKYCLLFSSKHRRKPGPMREPQQRTSSRREIVQIEAAQSHLAAARESLSRLRGFRHPHRQRLLSRSDSRQQLSAESRTPVCPILDMTFIGQHGKDSLWIVIRSVPVRIGLALTAESSTWSLGRHCDQ